jgi:hypothetical protein
MGRCLSDEEEGGQRHECPLPISRSDRAKRSRSKSRSMHMLVVRCRTFTDGQTEDTTGEWTQG